MAINMIEMKIFNFKNLRLDDWSSMNCVNDWCCMNNWCVVDNWGMDNWNTVDEIFIN